MIVARNNVIAFGAYPVASRVVGGGLAMSVCPGSYLGAAFSPVFWESLCTC